MVGNLAVQAADLLPEGGVMAGVSRYQLMLGPIPAGAHEIRFTFECTHVGCPGTFICCDRRPYRVRIEAPLDLRGQFSDVAESDSELIVAGAILAVVRADILIAECFELRESLFESHSHSGVVSKFRTRDNTALESIVKRQRQGRSSEGCPSVVEDLLPRSNSHPPEGLPVGMFCVALRARLPELPVVNSDAVFDLLDLDRGRESRHALPYLKRQLHSVHCAEIAVIDNHVEGFRLRHLVI